MDKQSKNLLKNKKGQSTVEYILLLGVVAFFVFTVMKSDKFEQFMGRDSAFFKAVALQIQYCYRHGRIGSAAQMQSDPLTYGERHDTFKKNEEQNSRFFSQLEAYPNR